MPETSEPAASAASEPAAPATAETAIPPWGDESNFDPNRAWELIQGLRADKAKLAERQVLTDEQKNHLAEYDRLVEASKTDLERKAEEVTRWQSEAEKWRSTSIASRIEALAAVDFADPSDAVSNLDPSKYLDAGGNVDEAAIKADLADVLTRKPHYRRQEASASRVPAPNRSQGSGANGKAVADPAAEFAAILQGQLSGPR